MPSRSQAASGLQRIMSGLSIAVLAATLLFNAVLAWVNAHIMILSPAIVSACQGMIVISALLLGGYQKGEVAVRWLALAWLLVMAVFLTSALRAQMEPKILGDILLIPAFILLGTRMDGKHLRQTIFFLQGLVTIVGIWELARPDQFGALFNVLDYYVQTRGYDAKAFWAGGELFLSSERPGGRLLLDGFGLHRGSSLFLEPVSLGNWTIVATLFTATMWYELSRLAKAAMAASILVLLIVCDGRLALSVVLMLCAYMPLCRWLPDRLSILYLPGLLMILALASMAGILGEAGDNFTGRLSVGLDALAGMDVDRLLGVAVDRIRLDDAGWADFVQAQSLIVSIGLWLILCLTGFGRAPADRMAKHGIMLFITLCLPISNSLLSIKTAAVMWTLYGYSYARSRRRLQEQVTK